MQWNNFKWIWLDYITSWAVAGDYRQDRIRGILPSEKNRWGMFRKTFELNADQLKRVIKAEMKISVDSRYKLFINEQYIGRGIYRCNRFNWYYDIYDVSKYLRPGKNVIGILATYFGEDMSWFEPFPHGLLNQKTFGKGALIFELQIQTSAGSIAIGSDSNVKGQVCNAFQPSTRVNNGLPFVEIFDASKYPSDWLSANFDDSDTAGWGHVLVLHQDVSLPNLIPCDIPRLTEEKVPAPKLITAGTVDPFFTAEDIADSQTSGEEPIDFFLQFGMSKVKNDHPELSKNWKEKKSIDITLKDKPIGLVFDMGKDVSGFIYFEFETTIPDPIVEIGWGEKLEDSKPKYSPYATKSGMQFKGKAGKNQYQLFHWYGFRYIQMNFSGSPGNIHVNAAGTTLFLYPVSEKGTFRSNNDKVNALYDACSWTLRNCMHDGYEDCPSREQRQWLGDAYVEIMANYSLFGDTALVKKLIRQTGQSQRGDGLTEMATPGDSHVHGLIIPDYCLYWISIIYEYYWYTGDIEIIREQFPAMIKAIRWFLGYINPVTGLVTDLPYWIFIDWSANDKWGACCPLNAQMYQVLYQLIDMGNLIGWQEAVEEFEEIAERIATSINHYLWDEKRGAYIDAVSVDPQGSIVKKSTKVTYHSNALAILYDLASSDRIEKIMGSVFLQPYPNTYVQNRVPLWAGMTPAKLDENKHVIMAEPFFMHHVHQMFAKVGRFDLIMKFLKDGWIKMQDQKNWQGTIWETWGDGGSLCHAWCTTPAYDLATHCLGVQILKAGGDTIAISPHPMELTEAEGTFPLVKGIVQVKWKWDYDNMQFILKYIVPPGVTVMVCPPKIHGKSAQKTIDLGIDHDWNTIQFLY